MPSLHTALLLKQAFQHFSLASESFLRKTCMENLKIPQPSTYIGLIFTMFGHLDLDFYTKERIKMGRKILHTKYCRERIIDLTIKFTTWFNRFPTSFGSERYVLKWGLGVIRHNTSYWIWNKNADERRIITYSLAAMDNSNFETTIQVNWIKFTEERKSHLGLTLILDVSCISNF